MQAIGFSLGGIVCVISRYRARNRNLFPHNWRVGAAVVARYPDRRPPATRRRPIR